MALRGAGPAVALLSCVLIADATSWAEPAASPWEGPLQAVDEALARRDIGAAVGEWHHGYVAALRSRRWLGLVEVGDAYLRIAEAGAFRGSPKPMARHLYLEALVWAKSQRSTEGALRMAAAFDRLGDHAVAEQCVRVAEASARRQRDPDALRQIAATRQRLGLLGITPPAARPIGAGGR